MKTYIKFWTDNIISNFIYKFSTVPREKFNSIDWSIYRYDTNEQLSLKIKQYASSPKPKIW